MRISLVCEIRPNPFGRCWWKELIRDLAPSRLFTFPEVHPGMGSQGTGPRMRPWGSSLADHQLLRAFHSQTPKSCVPTSVPWASARKAVVGHPPPWPVFFCSFGTLWGAAGEDAEWGDLKTSPFPAGPSCTAWAAPPLPQPSTPSHSSVS